MELKDIARQLPDEIWAVFEPRLPPVVGVGNGRKPCSNRDCLQGINWDQICVDGSKHPSKKGANKPDPAR